MEWLRVRGKALLGEGSGCRTSSLLQKANDWQFGKGRQHNKVVSLVLLLGNAKRSLEVTEPQLVSPFLPWGAHCLSKEVVAQQFFSGEQNHEGRGEHRPST